MTDRELFEQIKIFVPKDLQATPDTFISHLNSLVRPPFGSTHTIRLQHCALTISASEGIEFLNYEAHKPMFCEWSWRSFRQFLLQRYPASFYERETQDKQITIDFFHSETKQNILTQLNNAF